MSRLTILFILLFLNSTTTLFSFNESEILRIDSIPSTYQGYRLHIVAIDVEEVDSLTEKVNLSVFNTGKFSLQPSAQEGYQKVIFTYDNSDIQDVVVPLKEKLKRSLYKVGFNLDKGRFINDFEFTTSSGSWETLTQQDRAKPIASKDVITHTNEEKVDVITEVAEMSEVNEVAEIKDTSEKELDKPNHEETGLKITSQDRIDTSQNVEEINLKDTLAAIESPIDTFQYREDGRTCAELSFTNLEILKRTKRKITLKYVFKNNGSESVRLFKNKKSGEDNLAIKGYLSGTPRISRGDQSIGGSFLSKNKQLPEGVLEPGNSFEGIIKLDISLKTRYTNVLILHLDPFQLVHECDEGNNTIHLILD